MGKLWKYNDLDWRIRWDEGLVELDEDELVVDFLADLNAKDYIILENQDTGKQMWHLNSKRGNDTYARSWAERLKVICDGLSANKWDYPSPPRKEQYSDRTYRDTFILFMTCTIDDKAMSRVDAWRNISKYTHLFITRAKQVLKEIFSGAVTFTVKEGTERGYPAPHIVMITEKPIPVVYHYSEKEHGYKWIVVEKHINAVLHAIWYDITQSEVFDVRGICQGSAGDSGTVAYYLTKYLGKSVTPNNKTAVFTHAFQKLFRLRDQVGKAFLDRLEVGLPEKYNVRLETYYNELQKLRYIKRIKARLEHVLKTYDQHIFIEREFVRMIDYYGERIEDLLKRIPPPKWVLLECIRVQNAVEMQALLERVLSVSKHNATIDGYNDNVAEFYSRAMLVDVAL